MIRSSGRSRCRPSAGVVGQPGDQELKARTLSSLLFDVPPWDPAALASAIALLATATLAASYLPARRAARVDPVSILAAE